MFGPKRDKVTESGCCWHDERFHDLPAQNILWLIKMKVQLRCVWILVVKSEEIFLLERALCRS